MNLGMGGHSVDTSTILHVDDGYIRLMKQPYERRNRAQIQQQMINIFFSLHQILQT